MAAALALSLGAGPAPADARPEAPRSVAEDGPSTLASRRCNDISGSPLCVDWVRDANYNGAVGVSYEKRSGPTRYVRLYVASCGQPKVQVYEGNVSTGDLAWGAWDGKVYPGSCWIGYMRIGNSQWTTGELYS